MASAPASYKPPTRQRLACLLLDKSVTRLRQNEQPLRAAANMNKCTLITDGLDDVGARRLDQGSLVHGHKEAGEQRPRGRQVGR
eukprot:1479461-Pleurochrysis_carterae.AAC.1